ncbi:MAG: hypothetical protein ABJB74_06125 [Gemmatimonas sp.]
MNSPLAQPPTLRFALLVDHFDQSASGKLMLIGVFDNFFGEMVDVSAHGLRIPFSAGYLVAQIEASMAFGESHDVRVVCRDLDHNEVFSADLPGVPFGTTGPGMPLRGIVALKLGLILFKEFGQYEWVLSINGQCIGCCPFAVWEKPAA